MGKSGLTGCGALGCSTFRFSLKVDHFASVFDENQVFLAKKLFSKNSLHFEVWGAKCKASGNLQKCHRVNPVLTVGCTMKMMLNGTLLNKRYFCTHSNRKNLCNTFSMLYIFQAICYAVSTPKRKQKRSQIFSLPSTLLLPLTVSFVKIISISKNIFIFNHSKFLFI